MVPENEFHHKEQPARSATPASQQNGPGSTGKPATSTSKTEEGTTEDGGESLDISQAFFGPVQFYLVVNQESYCTKFSLKLITATAAAESNYCFL